MCSRVKWLLFLGVAKYINPSANVMMTSLVPDVGKIIKIGQNISDRI